MRTTEFKDTELGPIPKDWEVKRLGECCDTSSGGTPPRSVSDFYNGSIKWFTTSELRDCYLCDSTEHISQSALEASSAKIFPSGTLLMAMYGATIGRLGMLTNEAATNQACCAIFCNDCDVEFLFYYLLHNRARIISLGSGAGQPNISQQIVKGLQLSLPPLPEQRRIAAALGDVDKLIENLKKRVEKKKNLKRGAMQELLTGKRRLKGFTGAWVEKQLGETGEFFGGGTPSTSISSYWGGEVDWYTPAEIGEAKYVSASSRRITHEGLKNCAARILPVGTILLTTRATIGLRAILKHEAATNQGFQSLVVKSNFDSEFMYYYLSTIVDEMVSRASGSTFLEISSSKLKGIRIVVPSSLPEQRAIAAVLSDMDAEIANLEAKLKKMTLLKQGMMQDLLTGKVRLV